MGWGSFNPVKHIASGINNAVRHPSTMLNPTKLGANTFMTDQFGGNAGTLGAMSQVPGMQWGKYLQPLAGSPQAQGSLYGTGAGMGATALTGGADGGSSAILGGTLGGVNGFGGWGQQYNNPFGELKAAGMGDAYDNLQGTSMGNPWSRYLRQPQQNQPYQPYQRNWGGGF